MKLIYHGSSQVVESPRIIIQKTTKDFGFAFYCTLFQEQASRWASRGKKIGYVNCYRFDDVSALQNLNVKIFEITNIEWLDFVAGCRTGVTHNFDIVIGPMADDQIYNWVQMYINKEIDQESFFTLCRFKYPTNQIAFCTERSLRYIQYVNSRGVISK